MNLERDQYPSGDFHRLACAESSHWWFRGRNSIIVELLQKFAGSPDSILEVGCGTGFVLQAMAAAFPRAKIEAAELHLEGIEIARQRVPRAHFRAIDVRYMNTASLYGLIGAFDVLEHIEEDELVVNNLASALQPGGHLIVTVPQHRFLWSTFDEQACHARRYTRERLAGLFGTAGLSVVRTTSFVTLLLPAMLVARRRSRRTDYDPIDEFRLHPFLNTCFHCTLAIERRLIRVGLDLPFGGSLLMIGRKP